MTMTTATPTTTTPPPSSKPRLATIWLDGCSGCHMSFLDQDELLITLAARADLVYSPIVDTKAFPENVDITLVEGAVGNAEDLAKILQIRRNTRLLVSLGDCAVTGNVSAMRNPFGVIPILERVYHEPDLLHPATPHSDLPALRERVCPLHEVVHVDLFVPGCPPDAATIAYCLDALLEGRMPDLSQHTRFGK